MKKLALIIFVLSIGAFTNGFAQTMGEKSVPASELPAEGDTKTFYELDAEYDYKIYDFKGELITEGTAKSVETTELDPGIYYIKYDGKTFKFKKEGIAGMKKE